MLGPFLPWLRVESTIIDDLEKKFAAQSKIDISLYFSEMLSKFLILTQFPFRLANLNSYVLKYFYSWHQRVLYFSWPAIPAQLRKYAFWTKNRCEYKNRHSFQQHYQHNSSKSILVLSDSVIHFDLCQCCRNILLFLVALFELLLEFGVPGLQKNLFVSVVSQLLVLFFVSVQNRAVIDKIFEIKHNIFKLELSENYECNLRKP